MAEGGYRLTARDDDAGPTALRSPPGFHPGLEIQHTSHTQGPGGSLTRIEDRGPAPKRRRVTFSDMNDVREIPREHISREQTPSAQPEHFPRRKSLRFPTTPSAAMRSLRDYVKPPGRTEVARRQRAHTTAGEGTEARGDHRAGHAAASDFAPRARLTPVGRTPRPPDHREIPRVRRPGVVVREDEHVSRASERGNPAGSGVFGGCDAQAAAVDSSMQDPVGQPVTRSGSVIKSLARSLSRLGLSGRSSGRGGARAAPVVGPDVVRSTAAAVTADLEYGRGEFVVSSMEGECGPPRLDFKGYGPGW